MPILRVLGAMTLIAVTWWSMGEAAWSFDLIQSRVLETFQWTPPPPNSTGYGLDLIIFDYWSPCCADLYAARATAGAMTLVGAAPMALLALVLRRRRVLPAAFEPFLVAAYVFQFAGLAIALLLVLVSLSEIASIIEAAILTSFLRSVAPILAIGVISASALPVWVELRRRTAPAPPPSLKTAQ